ncbi:MAG: radical SAM protein, partial [Deltaproteobacteria bacterium]|nr:radical SAM protein [Deltaproteobacteria bacterium]
SGGGMTLSGGEPTAHPDFSYRLLKGARERGLNSCLDTNGYCQWDVLERLLEYTDIVLYDIKHLDPEIHRQWTGGTNELIINNLKMLLAVGVETWIRIPVVPGFNDSIDFHKAAADFLAGLPNKIKRIDLLPFHNWCEDKYNWLGVNWELREVQAMEPYFLELPAELYQEKGLVVTIGGSGFEVQDACL